MWANRLPLSLLSISSGCSSFAAIPTHIGVQLLSNLQQYCRGAASQLSLGLLPLQLTHVAFFGCRCSYTATGPFEQQLNKRVVWGKKV